MRRLWNTFLKGLVALLPVTLTVYLVWWLGSTAERVVQHAGCPVMTVRNPQA